MKKKATSSFHETSLHVEPEIHFSDWYDSIEASSFFHQQLGTRIWFATRKDGMQVCIKEFTHASAKDFERQIPDPDWENPKESLSRGLKPKRWELFQKTMDGSLKTEIQAIGPQSHTGFLQQFNAYSFEMESLITQFAIHYEYKNIVKASRWGAMQFPSTHQESHFALEMERLEPFELPTAQNGLEILFWFLQMLNSVSQLHNMLLPLSSFPPELSRNLEEAKNLATAHPFHFDLSPDQFLLRRNPKNQHSELVLIDFNSVRMAESDFSSFSWKMIPGKDYYQPPERRNHFNEEIAFSVFQANPLSDLYSLCIILVFMLAREESHQKIQEVSNWNNLFEFYNGIFGGSVLEQLEQSYQNQSSFELKPLLRMLSMILQKKEQDRISSLLQNTFFQWQGTHDWLLLPRVMDFVAREIVGRHFSIGWKENLLTMEVVDSPEEIEKRIDFTTSYWKPSADEGNRFPFPDFEFSEMHFFQEEGNVPILWKGKITPIEPGTYTLFASFGNCVDFENPLRIEVFSPSSAWLNPSSQTYSHLEPVFPTYSMEISLPKAESSTPLDAILSQKIVLEPTTPSYSEPLLHPFEILAISVSQTSLNNSTEEDFSSETDFPTSSSSITMNESPIIPKENNDSRAQEKLFWQKLFNTFLFAEIQELSMEINQWDPEKKCIHLHIAIQTKQVETSWKQQSTADYITHLRGFKDFMDSLEPTSFWYALALNNLTVLSYSTSFHLKQLPNWKTLLGSDPAQKLVKWLKKRKNSSASVSLFEKKILEHSQETLLYCDKIKKRLQK